ncbi:MAG: M1 family metallopeptidase [Bacteroidota bacterium]
MAGKIPRLILILFRLQIFLCLAGYPAFTKAQSLLDSIHVHHYEVDLDEVDFPGRQIKGHTHLQLSPNQGSLRWIQLELLNLSVDSVLISDIKSPFTYNGTLITIPLRISLGISDTLLVDVFYHGTPHIEPGGWGGFHFTKNNIAFNLGIALKETPHNFGKVWFACIDNFTDKAKYDFFITVSSPFVAVCGGTLIDSPKKDGKTRYHWKLDSKIPAYLASVAISDYVPVQGLYHGLKGDIPTFIYVNPADTLKARNSFVHLNQVLSIFENRFGPYRWTRVGFVSTSIGAMEHATNIAYPERAIDGTLNDESLYIHELSHSWFGDLVTCSSASDMWLNEGWAVFCESVAKEGLYGNTAYKTNIRTKLHAVLQKTFIEDKGYLSLSKMPEKDTYGSTVYDKGGIVVHTLRGYLGDSLFFATTKALLDSFAFCNISTQELKEFITLRTKINMDDFFTSWVDGHGFPHYSVDSFRVNRIRNEYKVTVYIRQRLLGTNEAFNSNRVELGFFGKRWEHQNRLIEFSGLIASKTFTLNFNPECVVADPEEKIGDASTDFGTSIKTTGNQDFPDTYFTLNTTQIKDSAYINVIHNWIAPDAILRPGAPYSLSQNRYWKIEGIFPRGFSAKGSFFYSKDEELDNTLLTDPENKLVILYRPNVSTIWEEVTFTKEGNTENGKLIVEHLFPGEYTLAVRVPYF